MITTRTTHLMTYDLSPNREGTSIGIPGFALNRDGQRPDKTDDQ